MWSHVGNLEEVSIIGGSKPVVTENIVIVSYSSGEIYALDHNDGTLIWFDNVTSGNFFNKSSLSLSFLKILLPRPFRIAL